MQIITKLEFTTYLTDNGKYVSYFKNEGKNISCGSGEHDTIDESIKDACVALITFGKRLISDE